MQKSSFPLSFGKYIRKLCASTQSTLSKLAVYLAEHAQAFSLVGGYSPALRLSSLVGSTYTHTTEIAGEFQTTDLLFACMQDALLKRRKSSS
jgi:hypothetical protein